MDLDIRQYKNRYMKQTIDVASNKSFWNAAVDTLRLGIFDERSGVRETMLLVNASNKPG